MKDVDRYQIAAETTDVRTYHESELAHHWYPLLGLAEETGELIGKIKKVCRDHEIHTGLRLAEHLDQNPDVVVALIKEGGDIIWYLSQFFHRLGIPMSRILDENLSKCADRRERLVIYGEGDDR